MNEDALAAARARAASARALGDWTELVGLGGWFEQHGAYADAWAALADAACLRKPPALPEWDGTPLEGQVVRVQRRMRHTGAELRMARLLGMAARNGALVQAVVEPRLVSLFSRSFPAVQVVPEGRQAALAPAHWGASYERLAQWLAPSAEAIAAGFAPLCADDAARRAWRARQGGADGRPVVGFAWHSDNTGKRLPSLADWAGLVRAVPAHFVSLQYDEEAAGRGELERLAGRALPGAAGFDQRSDLDGFAAQVAAVDAVVTISNTTAHMAGALGRPCLVLLDAHTGLTWPAGGTSTPFYPRTRLLRNERADWTLAMQQASAWLTESGQPASIDA